MTLTSKKTSSIRQVALKHGFRSGLEEAIALDLKSKGIIATFEAGPITYIQPEKKRKYTKDFILPNAIVIESKGRFVSEDRAKHLLIKAQHPDLEIRFVFSNPKQRISKASKTTYAMWCDKNGYTYSKSLTPVAWLQEPLHVKSAAVLAHFNIDKNIKYGS